jgi:hypothetical protein
MKTHEETWTRVLWMHDHNQDPIYGIESDAIPKKVDDHFCEFSAGEHARSQLAAAAPEMARLLLDVQWTPTGYDHEPCCPVCTMSKPRVQRDDANFTHGHSKDCAFVAVLVKAGVLPSGDT